MVHTDIKQEYNCRVYQNVAQTISDSTWTAIVLDAENFDEMDMHDNVTNNTRITIPSGADGKYVILGQISFLANVTGKRRGRVVLNGASTVLSDVEIPLSADIKPRVDVLTLEDLSAGDYIEIECYQNSGGNLDLLEGRENTFLSAIKVA